MNINPSRRESRLGLEVNQIHYYPKDDGDTLVRSSFPNGKPGILGEFATVPDVADARHWPDLGPDRQSITWRLRKARDLGYEAALPWGYWSGDDRTEQTKSVIENGLRAFEAE